MEAVELRRAAAAALSTAVELGLTADDAVVLHDSNRAVLRLVPCDVVARVAGSAHASVATVEVGIAKRLAEIGAPVGAPEPGVGRPVYERDGFVITLWTHYNSVPPPRVEAADYAIALERLHAGLRKLDVVTPHFTHRVAEAQRLVADRDATPALAAADRDLLGDTLRTAPGLIGDRGGVEQVLHGEPHPGNVLNTNNGPLFVDFETVCRGPVEFDLAHVPEKVSDRYPGLDREMLGECRLLVLAMVAAWRSDRSDQFPGGRDAARELIAAIRGDPPYPSLNSIMGE